jgi:hypothetical protein
VRIQFVYEWNQGEYQCLAVDKFASVTPVSEQSEGPALLLAIDCGENAVVRFAKFQPIVDQFLYRGGQWQGYTSCFTGIPVTTSYHHPCERHELIADTLYAALQTNPKVRIG